MTQPEEVYAEFEKIMLARLLLIVLWEKLPQQPQDVYALVDWLGGGSQKLYQLIKKLPPIPADTEMRGVYCVNCLSKLGEAKGGALVKRCACCGPFVEALWAFQDPIDKLVIWSNASSLACRFLDTHGDKLQEAIRISKEIKNGHNRKL